MARLETGVGGSILLSSYPGSGLHSLSDINNVVVVVV